MATDQEGAVSRRRFLQGSAMAAGALGMASLSRPSASSALAAGPLSSPQPPPDELLVTIRQDTAGGGFNVASLTSVLNPIVHPIGWVLHAIRVIAIPGQLPGGGSVTYTVIRYHNLHAPGTSVFLAAGAILAKRAFVQAHLAASAALVSVTPNWAIAAAPGLFIEGGPGGLPAADAACGKGWRFAFPTLPAGSHLRTAPAGATVVVLDTMPVLANLGAAAKRFPSNTLLGGVVTQVTAPGHIHNALGPAPLMPMARQVPCGSSTPYTQYLMADHGLYVAGIVHDIAPACSLMSVRVLNAWGAAYLSDLLAGLALVPAKGPVVVTMSLTVRMPSIAALHAELSSSHNSAITALVQEWLTLADACAPLALILKRLAANNVFLVAATGNDSGTGPLRDPCAPAAFESTLGVAAVSRLQQRACYSNRGDNELTERDSISNGIATFGGDPSGAVHGLYSASHLYLPPKNTGPLNHGGWAQWMGTSFATPVIAALAANYLANNPSAGPPTVISQLQSAGTMTDPSLNAPTILARQLCA